ncbi:hypothetical protein B0T19DRAFT_403762 [Cercophora scortea]|uniref:DUF2293 domain-containing protein n=1 Tax=Cercophora scortea TaxID=314031 RepID=A0AAE0I9S8_9PEZI|nr:hypothetical protein B0T19DRAFT_403762 [Cercophora scortea]
MGREKKAAPGVAAGNHAKDRHKRDRKGNLIDWAAPLPPGLVARPARPEPNPKHKSYLEFVENKDKKKKLEIEFTEDRNPPPGFQFVPNGNPALTTACKEMSRELGAMIFIVTSSSGHYSQKLSLHLNRIGHHIRETIVEQARDSLGQDGQSFGGADIGRPEPIPERQEDIDKQADAAIRDLFPRIPNTDRQMIIEHAFNKSKQKTSKHKTGEPLLAVLAHIRHNHTRYDQLLRETSYVFARKAVETLCLDILVKWRGDEENGRDDLNEILREVVVISDSDSEDEEDEDDEDADQSSDVSSMHALSDDGMDKQLPPSRQALPPASQAVTSPNGRSHRGPGGPHTIQKVKKTARKERRPPNKAHRGFSRYQAVREQAWHQAVERQRLGNDEPIRSAAPATSIMNRSASHGSQLWQPAEAVYAGHEVRRSQNPQEPPVHVQRHSRNNTVHYIEAPQADWDRPAHENAPRRIASSGSYRLPPETGNQELPPSNRFGPIVGPRAELRTGSEVGRARLYDQDLKDYPVRSIETNSPESSHFPAQFQGPLYRQERRYPQGTAPSTETAFFTRSPAMISADFDATQHHMANPQEEFVRLPPRYEAGHAMPAHGPRPEPQVTRYSDPRCTVRSYAPSGLHHSSVYHDSAVDHPDGPRPVLRSESRPIWIEDDDGGLRSKSRPVLIQDHSQPWQNGIDSAHFPSSARPISVIRGPPDTHRSESMYNENNNVRQMDTRGSRHVKSLSDDFVEIVRISDSRFPPRYEPHQMQVDERGYEVRPSARQHHELRQPANGGERYELRSQYPPQQRVERVVRRVEEPPLTRHDMVLPDAGRRPDAYASAGQRIERVVGIEYLPTSHSHENQPYARRLATQDPNGLQYQSHATSMIPGSYPGPEYQPPSGHPLVRRDRVIVLD